MLERPALQAMANTYMPENKYDRLPQAGDFERESGTEVFYLPPKPLPTGMPAFSSRQLHRGSNEVFLDFAVGRGTFEFMSRGGIGSVIFMVLFFFLFSCFTAYVASQYNGAHVVKQFLIDFINPYFWLFILFLATMYGSTFFYAVRQVSIRPPIRFNRQRREVAFVFKKGEAPRYIPW